MIPNSIQVLVKDNARKDDIIKPFPIKDGAAENLSEHNQTCGANNYHYEKGIVEFVVNGKDSCQVRVRLSSFIQLSARIDMDINDFYNNNGATTFITNICVFLGIDTGRLKIVGISSGSVHINAQLLTEDPSIDEAQTANGDPVKEAEELNRLAAKLKDGTENNPGINCII